MRILIFIAGTWEWYDNCWCLLFIISFLLPWGSMEFESRRESRVEKFFFFLLSMLDLTKWNHLGNVVSGAEKFNLECGEQFLLFFQLFKILIQLLCSLFFFLRVQKRNRLPHSLEIFHERFIWKLCESHKSLISFLLFDSSLLLLFAPLSRRSDNSFQLNTSSWLYDLILLICSALFSQQLSHVPEASTKNT